MCVVIASVRTYAVILAVDLKSVHLAFRIRIMDDRVVLTEIIRISHVIDDPRSSFNFIDVQMLFSGAKSQSDGICFCGLMISPLDDQSKLFRVKVIQLFFSRCVSHNQLVS